MSKKQKDRLANILIMIGSVFIVFAVVYEAANYPWHNLFLKWGLVSESELKDPAPLPARATTAGTPQLLPAENGEEIPIQPTWVTVRPVMDITQIGIIKVPRLRLSENVVEGTDDEMLYGVGHVRGTAMPGQKGNCVLAGHRNYVIMHPFRHLDLMEVGDRYTITDAENIYTYEVYKTLIINPDDVWILKPQEEEPYLAILLTCTPVINPTHRLTVWARLVDTQPNTEKAAATDAK